MQCVALNERAKFKKKEERTKKHEGSIKILCVYCVKLFVVAIVDHPNAPTLIHTQIWIERRFSDIQNATVYTESRPHACAHSGWPVTLMLTHDNGNGSLVS